MPRRHSNQLGFLKQISAIMAFALVLMLLAGPQSIAQASRDEPSSGSTKGHSGAYIVRMLEEPAVAYAGGIAGLKATKPAKGQKIDPYSSDVVNYVAYLDARHSTALRSVGGASKLYDYHYSFNGFAAKLTPAQAAKLAATPGVLAVTPDAEVQADTSSTPDFLGLTAPGGLWSQLGGVHSAGEGIIIGIIDSGIWPESLSFSDRIGTNGNASKDGKLDYQQIPGWHGKCTPGEDFTASLCNQKLIGAQYFNASWGGNAGIDAQRPWEFNSVRDYNGHGTHTSSTSGGNSNVPTNGPAAVFGKVSGMAPHARIAAYKALWSTQDASTASGNTTDLVAAIDQAVADGVDVINYSISGTLTNFRDPAEIAFLYAAQAGVFVAASAGNSGPTTSTVAHPSPWITTVAAGTHNRDGQGSVTLGNGVSYSGASVATAVGPAPLIDATAAGLPGADPTALSLCFAAIDNGGAPVLDPAKVAGKIVVCDRGVNARVNKSLAVQEAGGAGMILLNTSVNSINADFHFVPTVHLQSTDRAAVKAYAATAGATATINQATIIYNAAAPFTASFSSRGPLQASGDLLKPDLIAPGQDILAAVAPPGNSGRDFNLYSGTSMSSPHVAGLAALLKDLHPTWSPMAIKSALMTSAYDVLDGPNTNPLVIFRQGAGHVKPNSAADPGLVFDSSWNDWMGFLCGTQLPTSFCTGSGIAVLDPSDFNGASIAIADLAGQQTVTRTVTNVGAKGTYNVSVSATGFNVSVSPATFTLNPGQKQKLQITVARTTAALNAYAGAQITWSDGTHSVRIPVVVKPVALAAPAQVSGSYNVTFGYTGAFAATPRGLVPATTFQGSVSTDPTGTFKPVVSDSTVKYEVVVPAGTTYARFSLFDANVSTASDLDLYVYNSGGAQVGSSGGGTSAEEVNLLNPAAGTYTVWVHGFATGNPSTFTLFAWALGSADAGNMTVTAPAGATLGQTGAINLSFSGLTAGTKYLGSIAYSGVTGMPNPTIVRVDP
ncbi:MAG: S8 family serine peptidase [Kouleothrix sp.]|nr:S8 family serine peptidase [Kouleothrix sp.]